MKSRTLMYGLAVIVALVSVFSGSPARADYPDKPFEVIVGAGAGGGADTFCRTAAMILERKGIVKQKIQVVNKTGGAQVNALNYLFSKQGDPYTLMNVSGGVLAALMTGNSKVKLDDMVFLAQLSDEPTLILTRYDSPYNDLKSLLADAKKNHTRPTFGFALVGGQEHVCGYRIQKASGVQLNMVGFGSGTAAATALLGGHVQIAAGGYGEQVGQIEAKKIKILGTMTAERISFLPNVPTMKEQGIDASYTQVRGFGAYKGFPDYAQKFWQDAFAKLIKTQEFTDYNKSTYSLLEHREGEAFKAYTLGYLKNLEQDVSELMKHQKK